MVLDVSIDFSFSRSTIKISSLSQTVENDIQKTMKNSISKLTACNNELCQSYFGFVINFSISSFYEFISVLSLRYKIENQQRKHDKQITNDVGGLPFIEQLR